MRTRHQKRMLAVEQGVLSPPKRFVHVRLEAQVRLSAPVFDTEDRSKVEAAVRALFPDFRPAPGAPPTRVEGSARDLRPFAETLRHQRTRDTARDVLKDAVGLDRRIHLLLNKQAAAARRINFVSPGSVLGEIEVTIEAPEPEFLAEELTWIEGESDERLLGTKRHLQARWGAGAPRRPR